MTIQDVNQVEKESLRLQRRINELKKRHREEGDNIFYGCKETGALKRAALDLKMELSNVTK